jgi:hypothetical protein
VFSSSSRKWFANDLQSLNDNCNDVCLFLVEVVNFSAVALDLALRAESFDFNANMVGANFSRFCHKTEFCYNGFYNLLCLWDKLLKWF